MINKLENIDIISLSNSKNNRQIVKNLILKDVSNSCFSNKDIEGNIIPIEDMASIYLEYTNMYGIKFNNIYIGLLSLTNENEISIFIVPEFQNMGLGKKVLLKFLEIVHKEFSLEYFVAEVTKDNIRCIKMISNIGFDEVPNESRVVPINGNDTLVKKYKLNYRDIKNNVVL